jgi:hypothetical protein
MSVRYDITADSLSMGGFRQLHAGDDYDHDFTLQRDGVVFNLTGAKIWFTVKEASVEADAAAKLQLDSATPADVEITDAAAGEFTVHFQQDATTDLEGKWDYDIQVLTAAGEVITWARGKIEFLENLTRTVV